MLQYTLKDLDIDDVGYVSSLIAGDDIRRRLLDMGLVEGTKVKCVLKSPAGDPVAYNIRGAVVAIRNEDSEKILLKLNM
ncbi:MAG: ferrous iron transport protein A [Clostridia bacterium]|nr:ferrous iron transport protein A [Clostridia bacterium]MBQ4542849.1 ferrous iron transport protein A [Clostridia bacterium]MBQ7076337.1 ferrous iron transport protein A [Clostridia bacterium]MBQ9997493.1 ferrous iron transport protein A [Clostridia bacterium]